jgi:hypothetical protein
MKRVLNAANIVCKDSKYAVHIVEIVKGPGQTLGLYIREGNGMDLMYYFCLRTPSMPFT